MMLFVKEVLQYKEKVNIRREPFVGTGAPSVEPQRGNAFLARRMNKCGTGVSRTRSVRKAAACRVVQKLPPV